MRLLAPLIHLAALFLLVEDWFWDLGARLVRAIGHLAPVMALEARIRALPPYGALCTFALPAIVLFPIRLLALIAMANGYVLAGAAVYLTLRIAGAALLARLYTLTGPSLLTLAWVARLHDAFLALKARWIGKLRASGGYRRSGALAHSLRAAVLRARHR